MSKNSIHPLCLSRPPIQLQTFTLLKTPRIRSDPSRGCSCLRLRFSDIRIAPAEVRSGSQRSLLLPSTRRDGITRIFWYSNPARSRCLSVVVIQHPSQPTSAADIATCSSLLLQWNNQPVLQSLVVSFQMIMGREFAKCPSQRAFAK